MYVLTDSALHEEETEVANRREHESLAAEAYCRRDANGGSSAKGGDMVVFLR
jgi:hypothetical protein